MLPLFSVMAFAASLRTLAAALWLAETTPAAPYVLLTFLDVEPLFFAVVVFVSRFWMLASSASTALLTSSSVAASLFNTTFALLNAFCIAATLFAVYLLVFTASAFPIRSFKASLFGIIRSAVIALSSSSAFSSTASWVALPFSSRSSASPRTVTNTLHSLSWMYFEAFFTISLPSATKASRSVISARKTRLSSASYSASAAAWMSASSTSSSSIRSSAALYALSSACTLSGVKFSRLMLSAISIGISSWLLSPAVKLRYCNASISSNIALLISSWLAVFFSSIAFAACSASLYFFCTDGTAASTCAFTFSLSAIVITSRRFSLSTIVKPSSIVVSAFGIARL